MYAATVFLPLIGAIIAGLFGRLIGDKAAGWVCSGALLLSALLAVPMFIEVAVLDNPRDVELLTWIDSGTFEVSWALRFDALSAVMVLVVSFVSAMIHVYSIGYMAADKSVPRFFSYLSLFTFFMLALVTANNFLQLYFGWEGVGLASYLLIGFWYERPAANAAAIKAFIVNRVGDFGFALGIMAVFFLFNSVGFDTVFAATPGLADETFNFLGWEVDALTTICLLLFLGAMGKSAQLGLHTWLPDAMEGPTPVSALIHAATMVTAGVFMVVRLSPMFEYAPIALAVVAIVGASTAFFAATVAMVQNDIKRVIAYSTCSQLGYMFFAIGVSAYSAAIFHLVTHAFFKALLFLASGAVIHAMSDEQDMRKMGGIWRAIPITYGLMWTGSLALAGMPFLAGFYSKDIIIESAFAAATGVGQYAFWLGVIVAALTAFYSWRLILMTFHGAPRADEKVMAHVHEAPKTMWIPMVVLAVGAIVMGKLGFDVFVGEGARAFWRDSIVVLPAHTALEDAHDVPLWVKLLPLVVALGGIILAYIFYMFRPALPGLVAGRFRAVHTFLVNKWYFDAIYDRVFVSPANAIGLGFWKSGDGAVIDGIGPDGLAAATRELARLAGRLQSGYVYHYAFAMLIGVAGLVSWYLFQQAG
ncbi:MAG: NADH-quinone oxidoreductase subunit L [Alphaproteobacteria bacterium]|nr:NADH-quinone oxidoreductase subunit L [Pseudomonadota bacterium]MCZ6483182.1 NADH-quinone oxidoreductase subunit L [Alphaproteobacteria bacterium]